MTDAVVVGSGPNGLAAAIRLAESGRWVVVLEAADSPGGAVRTEALTLPGFRHDTFSAVHPAAAASPVFARMPLAEHGLEWVHPAACSAHPLPDGRAVVLYGDLQRTARGLDDLHPGDGERWATFAAPLVEHFSAVRRTMLSGFPPIRGPLELAARSGPATLLAFTGLLFGSAESLGRKLFVSDGARAWLSGAAMHGDVAPDGRGSAIAAAYLNLLGHTVGWPSPRGGAERLTDALVGYLERLGGEVRTGARVERVLVERGVVRGVGVAGGDAVLAPIVVADVMPGALLELTGGALSGRYASGLRRFRPGPATLKIDWALDGPIPWAAEAVRESGTVHVGGGQGELMATIAASAHGLPERPFLLLGQQSVADPTRAPAGGHTAWAYTHGPAAADWAAGEAAHVEAVEAQVERFAPGFRDRILARHVLGPAAMQARNANLVDGDVGGGSYVLRQAVFRPVPKIDPYRTPVRGLFLGSAATFPGGAVHGVPGDAAARSALRAARGPVASRRGRA